MTLGAGYTENQSTCIKKKKKSLLSLTFPNRGLKPKFPRLAQTRPLVWEERTYSETNV